MINREIISSESVLSRWTRRCYAVLLVLIGTGLLAGGVILAGYGGSIYYLIAGLVVAASGVLVWRRDRRGAWLYGAMLAAMSPSCTCRK